MNYPFELSPYFTIERGRTARNIKTVDGPGYNLVPEIAAFIAAILAVARAEFAMPSSAPPRNDPPEAR